MFNRLAAFLLLIAFASPRASEWEAFYWEGVGITLTLPFGWTTTEIDGETLTITDGANLTIRLHVLEGGDIVDVLASELPVLDLLHFGYQPFMMYGRSGWRVEAVSSDRAYSGEGRIGYLPDDRIIAAVARWTGVSVALDQLLAGLSLSDAIFPDFQQLWTDANYTLTQVAYSESGIVYGLNGTTGIVAYDALSGTLIGEYPFENPSQPTDIAADSTGIAYVSDIVCRCLLRLQNGAWVAPVGAFAGNAPLGVAVSQNGAIYAIDRSKEGNYALHIVGQEDLIPLNFNAAAPPFVLVDGDGSPLVIERLTSLLDGAITGYLSAYNSDSAQSGFWLTVPMSADNLDITGDGRGGVVIAGATIAYETLWQTRETLLNASGRSAALSSDGLRLFVIDSQGALTGYLKSFPVDRAGSPENLSPLIAGYGTVSETIPMQTWTYAGTAGETLTISAIDPVQTDSSQVGLDMALRVFDPNGNEIAYKDDQIGVDLFSPFDAQIPDLVLPADGEYTVAIEWVQGEGGYLISVRSDHPAQAGADGVIRVNGHLYDAAPVERWTFEGTAGDLITLSMIAQSGDLDPALELLNPDGSQLAYNDDTTDPALGVNAQINRVRLPATGTYIIEASRFEGSGRYELVILQVE